MKKNSKSKAPFPWKLTGIMIVVLLLMSMITIIWEHEKADSDYVRRGIISERGLIDAFPAGLTNASGKMINCEASAIVYDGQNLIIASDKPIPGDSKNPRSSVFYMNYSAFPSAMVTYYTAPAFVGAVKYEDFTITPDGQYIIATTGFDRVHYEGTSEWDGFNTMLIWPVGKPDEVKIVSSSTTDGVTSSVGLREKIASSLKTDEFPDGVPYFKIEGLAAIPGNQLLLGIRELGESFRAFDYAIKIISVSYDIAGGDLILSDDYHLVYEYDPAQKSSELGGRTVALSSIEYDPYHDRLYLLTSYENSSGKEITDEDIGAFLWILPIHNLNTDKAPELVLKKSESTPILFAHKGEGITVINEKRVIIIHDDDRVLGRQNVVNPETQFSRKPNQAAYAVVDFN